MTLIRRLLFALGNDARRMPSLLVQMTLVALLELVTIGGIPPLVSAVTSPQSAAARPTLGLLQRVIGSSDPRVLVGALGSALLVLFLLKAVLSAATSHRQFKFSYDAQINIGRRMLQQLLTREYSFFLQENTAILLKNVTTEVQLFTGGVLIPLLQLATQALILVTIVMLVAWASPVTALVTVGAVGGMIALLYSGLQRRLTAWGLIREETLSALTRTTHQALAGVKVVKTMGAEQFFLHDFTRHGAVYARANTRYQTAAVTPPLLIELALFGSGIAIILFFAARGQDLTAMLPILTLIAVAAYRILPAARLIFAHVVTIRFNLQSLDVIVRALEQGEPPRAADTATTPVAPLGLTREIRLSGVEYRYPGAAKAAVEDVSVVIPAGSHVAFIGSSGAGKTTVMDLVLGLLSPTAGTIAVDGTPLEGEARLRWQRSIGYVPQQVFLADASLRENVAFGVPAAQIDDPEVERAVSRACLGGLVSRLPEGLRTLVGENGMRLSGGERQRIAIARALYRDPRVLILDEATSALDSVTERSINEELLGSAGDLTVIIVAHRLSTVRTCDRLFLLEDGRLRAHGSYDELVRASKEFATMDRLAVGS